jgi:(2R)-3-sulfolactate dehydrogenase (NADP+)
VAAMLADDGVRIPGARRNQLATAAIEDGVDIPDALIKQLRGLASAG